MAAERGVMQAEAPATDLLARARRWLDEDGDPDTRAELQALIDAREMAQLQARFDGRLAFGTAGLRGLLGAGPQRMNRSMIALTTRGLCDYLSRCLPDAASRGLCVGFDGRHKSREFAEEVARVAGGAGFVVRAFEGMVPTPLLAFSVLDESAAAGVMVTASHNPAEYNGYKVYWSNGAQINAPHDAGISACIDALPAPGGIARLDPGSMGRSGSLWPLGAATERRYLDGLARRSSPRRGSAPLRIAYTALHGVGEPLARAALSQAGFVDVHSVPEQASPDPDFPTVRFPNPEEPGAMDRVLALGERVGAQLVLANDPDADRLRVAARADSGRLQPLSGNDLGVLLADYLLGLGPASPRRLVLSSIVSTPLVERVARAHGAHWEATLTGFKWICNRALELEQETGAQFVFGFEEALGYCPGTLVRDKDGIGAAVLCANLAAELAAHGETLWDRLAALWREHGVHVSEQLTVKLDGPDGPTRMAALMGAARSHPPTEFAGRTVLRVRDLLDDAELPASDTLLWYLEGDQRIALRPSGTEPKAKIYLDVREPVSGDGDVRAAHARALQTSRELREAVAATLG